MSKMSELIARARIRTAQIAAEKLAAENSMPIPANEVSYVSYVKPQSQPHEIQYNSEQQAFIDIVCSGKNAILIGAAGTGKTTTMKGAIASLLQNSHIQVLTDSHKHLPVGTPGIVACSYTRRSVANLRHSLPEDMRGNCITIHKLLEYFPEFNTISDPETGESRVSMQFRPARGLSNPLDSAISLIIIDEASTVSTELHSLLELALWQQIQMIYIGDINQLPPVFGSAILGYKGIELEKSTVELTQVYRQALESPIIKLAHRILSGTVIPLTEFPQWNYPEQLTLHPWKKKISAEAALLTVASFFKRGYDSELYNPQQDMILIPFNKSCGTDELNKHIANHIARTKSCATHEIIAGFNKLYLSIGDIVLYDKEDAVVTEINHNGLYGGKWPQAASQRLDYWGHRTDGVDSVPETHESEEEFESRVDQMISLVANSGEESSKTRDASHVITICRKEDGEEIRLSTAAELNSISLGYALTVHKSQGSEWRKVFCIFHQSHATMMQRELLYTAITRAREELYVICEPDTFIKGIQNQRIKGETLAEKFEFFKGKIQESN